METITGEYRMTEDYRIQKQIPSIGLDIDIKTPDRELLLILDDTIRGLIIKHYGLTQTQME